MFYKQLQLFTVKTDVYKTLKMLINLSYSPEHYLDKNIKLQLFFLNLALA